MFQLLQRGTLSLSVSRGCQISHSFRSSDIFSHGDPMESTLNHRDYKFLNDSKFLSSFWWSVQGCQYSNQVVISKIKSDVDSINAD